MGLQLGGLSNNHKQFFLPHKDPIDEIVEVAQVWRKPKEWKSEITKKILGK